MLRQKQKLSKIRGLQKLHYNQLVVLVILYFEMHLASDTACVLLASRRVANLIALPSCC